MNCQKVRETLESLEGTQMKLLDKEQASKLLAEYNLPPVYVEFLMNVGYGRIGKSRFQFYDGVVFVDEIFGYDNQDTANLLLFGDGACSGFDRKTWQVVRVLSDQSIITIAETFEDFIIQEFS